MYQTTLPQDVEVVREVAPLRWRLEEIPESAAKLVLLLQRLMPLNGHAAPSLVTDVPVVAIQKEFLPSGWWPIVQNGNGTRGGGKRRALDPLRYSFFDGLHPTVQVIGFRGATRSYSAFIVQAHSGRPVALVDAPVSKNALYIFRADMPHWGDVATLTKLDVLTGSYPEFVCRVPHQGNWQQRVSDLLAVL